MDDERQQRRRALEDEDAATSVATVAAAAAGDDDDRWRGKVRRRHRTVLRELRKERPFRSLTLALLAARAARPAAETCRFDVECHPGLPYHRNMLWKVALYAGMRLLPYRPGATSPAAGDRPRLRLFWPIIDPSDADAARRPPDDWWRGALNAGSLDTGKPTVERVFGEVFGYDLAVDPTTYDEGPYVAKAAYGSTHDGRVLDRPMPEADPSLTYQVLVDNRTGRGTVMDLRVPVIGGEMPFVYLKERPVGTRFSNTNSAVALARPEDVFSEAERGRLRAFCRAMRLDMVEIDVLRDRASGRIYVVDANRPVWGPPRPMRTADAVRAVRAYAAAFARLAERAVADA